MKLRDWAPSDFMGCEYKNSPARKYADVEVIQSYGSMDEKRLRWAGDHKNVICWCILANGMAVGWNESPSHGWGFPVLSRKAVTKYLDFLDSKGISHA